MGQHGKANGNRTGGAALLRAAKDFKDVPDPLLAELGASKGYASLDEMELRIWEQIWEDESPEAQRMKLKRIADARRAVLASLPPSV
jgi:hypothetical protein